MDWIGAGAQYQPTRTGSYTDLQGSILGVPYGVRLPILPVIVLCQTDSIPLCRTLSKYITHVEFLSYTLYTTHVVLTQGY